MGSTGASEVWPMSCHEDRLAGNLALGQKHGHVLRRKFSMEKNPKMDLTIV